MRNYFSDINKKYLFLEIRKIKNQLQYFPEKTRNIQLTEKKWGREVKKQQIALFNYKLHSSYYKKNNIGKKLHCCINI